MIQRRLLVALAFTALCFGVAVAPAVVAQLSQRNCCLVDAAGGVTSINTETGDITLTSAGGSVTITPSGQTIDLSVVAPTPIPCPTAGTNITVTGTDLPACTIATTAGLGAVNLLPSPNPTTSPNNTQNGYVAVKGLFLDCQGPLPGPSPPPGDCYKMIVYQNSVPNGGCENQFYNDLGTTSLTLNGVQGNQLVIGCDQLADGPHFTIGGDTNADGDATQYAMGLQGDLRTGGSIYLNGSRGVKYEGASSTVKSCGITTGGAESGVAYGHITTGTCKWTWADLAASSALCTDASSTLNPCSGLTTNSGEVKCNLASDQTCTATATVRANALCTASPNSTDTTAVTTLQINTPQVSAVVAGVVTFTLVSSVTGTGQMAANYQCL